MGVLKTVPLKQKVMTRLPGRLREVALLFLKLGALSFGGPAVYIALMHRETVQPSQLDR